MRKQDQWTAWACAAGICAGMLAGSEALAGGLAAPNPAPPPVVKTPVQVNPGLLCPNLVAKLTIDTSIAMGNGIIKLHGMVCNEGAVDYLVPPASAADSEYMVHTRHLPKTYAQEGDLKFPGHQNIGAKVQVGKCVAHELSLTVPGVIRWVTPSLAKKRLAPGQRAAEKQLVFRLNRNYPQNGNFTKTEDCSSEDNVAAIEVPYVEKAP
jgi:hypothetical protein